MRPEDSLAVDGPTQPVTEDDDVIYVVVTVRWHGDARAVGFYYDKDDAAECIERNLGDIHEDGFYPLALIERTKPGLYPVDLAPETETWYRWTGPRHHIGTTERGKGYTQCEKPDKFKRTLCFGLG